MEALERKALVCAEEMRAVEDKRRVDGQVLHPRRHFLRLVGLKEELPAARVTSEHIVALLVVVWNRNKLLGVAREEQLVWLGDRSRVRSTHILPITLFRSDAEGYRHMIGPRNAA